MYLRFENKISTRQSILWASNLMCFFETALIIFIISSAGIGTDLGLRAGQRGKRESEMGKCASRREYPGLSSSFRRSKFLHDFGKAQYWSWYNSLSESRVVPGTLNEKLVFLDWLHILW